MVVNANHRENPRDIITGDIEMLIFHFTYTPVVCDIYTHILVHPCVTDSTEAYARFKAKTEEEARQEKLPVTHLSDVPFNTTGSDEFS